MREVESDIAKRIEGEIARLHAYFVVWFAGSCAKDRAQFDANVTLHLGHEFELIAPGGGRHGRAAIADAIYAAHATNPAFQIAIRAFSPRMACGELVLVTYEEWQKGAKSSTPPENGRISSALFRVGEAKLEWVHIHETWLPAEVIAAANDDL